MSDTFKRALAIVVMLAFGAGLLMAGLREQGMSSRLDEEGVKTVGVVKGGQSHRGRRGSTSHSLEVAYGPKGSAENATTNRKSFDVSKETYAQAEQTGYVTVEYLPDDMAVARVGRQNGYVVMLVIAAGLLLAAVGTTVYTIRAARSPVAPAAVVGDFAPGSFTSGQRELPPLPSVPPPPPAGRR